MLAFMVIAILAVGLVEGQAITSPPTISSGQSAPSKTVVSTPTVIGTVRPPLASSTTTECWRVKDYGAGVTGTLPVPPTSAVISGSVASAAAKSGVQCWEVYSYSGGLERIPIPTALPATNNATPTLGTTHTTNSNDTSSRVLVPSIIVPICSIALIACAAFFLRRHIKAKGKAMGEGKWTTLREESIPTDGRKTNPAT